jgi:hypothetical protein
VAKEAVEACVAQLARRVVERLALRRAQKKHPEGRR